MVWPVISKILAGHTGHPGIAARIISFMRYSFVGMSFIICSSSCSLVDFLFGFDAAVESLFAFVLRLSLIDILLLSSVSTISMCFLFRLERVLIRPLNIHKKKTNEAVTS